jgi:hypothetical protein
VAHGNFFPAALSAQVARIYKVDRVVCHGRARDWPVRGMIKGSGAKDGVEICPKLSTQLMPESWI